MRAGLLVAASIGVLAAWPACADTTQFEVSFAAAAHPGPITGRLVLILATRETPEPRLTVHPLGPAIFGVDLDQLEAGESIIVDDSAGGYPMRSLAEVPEGDYFAQAVIHVYTQVHRADRHRLWVHMNDGTISTFNTAPGNLFSGVTPVHIGQGGTIRIVVDQIISPVESPHDTEWVKRVQIQSAKLTEFWGHPVFINATVLLPRGYAENPDVHYPTIFTFGHNVPFSFNTDPAGMRGREGIDPVTGLETGYAFHQSWISDDFPRVIAISFQQQTPFFPDSYSVNSGNNGPYGDAMIEEVIPWLEEHFRMIPKPYARIVEGASTGGWQALALQLKYPDYFGGAWVLQPDPIDFTRYGLVNIYEDDNAFVVRTGPFTETERPMRRTVDGQVLWTMRDLSRFEAVLGSHGRSGYQLMAWEAVYGPAGEDGYPRPLWDKNTGEIDREVAISMRENGFDLREYAKRNWDEIGHKVNGKLFFFCGDMDDFYLNLAVYEFEKFLHAVEESEGINAGSVAKFTYGRPRKGHFWHATTWAQMVRDMAEHIRQHAPEDANELWVND